MSQQRLITLMGFVIVCLIAIVAFMAGQRNPSPLSTQSTPNANTIENSAAEKVPSQTATKEKGVDLKPVDPALEKDDLIGTWAIKSSGCATDDTLSFQRHGGYHAFGAEGRWVLSGNSVSIFINREMTGEVDENDEDIWQMNKPEKKYTYNVKRLSNNEVIINRENYIRC